MANTPLNTPAAAAGTGQSRQLTASLDNASLNKLIRSSKLCLQGSNTKRVPAAKPAATKPIKIEKPQQLQQQQRIKKIKSIPNEFEYDDESKYDEFKFGNQDYKLEDNNDLFTTDDMNEATSETATSENDIALSGRGGLNNNDDDYDTDTTDENDNVDNNEDTTSSDLDGKLKSNKRNQNINRHFKEEWNSGEDTNERYCICKDISYGDMIMCDNSRVNCLFIHNNSIGICPIWCCKIAKKFKKIQFSFI